MKPWQIAMVLAIAAVGANGCGTVCNLIGEEPKMPFGGVQTDLSYIMSPKKDSPAGCSSGGMSAVGAVALVGADITLSAVGDTLTFPVALYLIKRAGYHNPNPTETADPPPSSGKVFSTAIVDN